MHLKNNEYILRANIIGPPGYDPAFVSGATQDSKGNINSQRAMIQTLESNPKLVQPDTLDEGTSVEAAPSDCRSQNSPFLLFLLPEATTWIKVAHKLPVAVMVRASSEILAHIGHRSYADSDLSTATGLSGMPTNNADPQRQSK